jgi:hypothetical protein
MAMMKPIGSIGTVGRVGHSGWSEAMMESVRNPFEPFATYEEWCSNFSAQTFLVMEDYYLEVPPKKKIQAENEHIKTLKDLASVSMDFDTVSEAPPMETVLLYPERTVVSGAELLKAFEGTYHQPPLTVLINGLCIRSLKLLHNTDNTMLSESPVYFNGYEDDVIADMFLEILPVLPAEQLARLLARKNIPKKISNLIRQFLA